MRIGRFVPIHPEEKENPRIDRRRRNGSATGQRQDEIRRTLTGVRSVQLKTVVRSTENDHEENENDDLEREKKPIRVRSRSEKSHFTIRNVFERALA